MTKLTNEAFQEAMSIVNRNGFACLDIADEILPWLGEDLYSKMDLKNFHRQRSTYYNEIAFYWLEDWQDVEQGLGAFHEQKSLKNILPIHEARLLLKAHFGEPLASAVIEFVVKIKTLIINTHSGLPNNELRLARVMLRQMNENDRTQHVGAGYHEDCGYSDRAYQQLLSVIVTTHGKPTEAPKYTPRIGELLIFNATDRREILGMDQSQAFIHKGPQSGPKMFFFFEFLGPRA